MKELLISKRCANSKTKSSVTECNKIKIKTNEVKFMLKKKKKPSLSNTENNWNTNSLS